MEHSTAREHMHRCLEASKKAEAHGNSRLAGALLGLAFRWACMAEGPATYTVYAPGHN